MSSGQKIIKYLAMAFAVGLAFSIISSIFYGVMMFTEIMDFKDTYIDDENTYIDEDVKLEEISSIEFSNLDIEIMGSSLVIKEGDSYNVETNNKYIKAKNKGNTLYIEENEHSYFKRVKDSKVIITIPSSSKLNDVSIENGAGSMNINYLNTNNLELDLGAGRVNINNLVASNKSDIDTGAGEVIIKSSILNNLDLDLGVGSFKMNADIRGNSTIDQGVGEVDINLIGSKNDYYITLDKGLGNAIIDGVSVNDDTNVGNGSNKIDISGGVGSIKVNFLEN